MPIELYGKFILQEKQGISRKVEFNTPEFTFESVGEYTQIKSDESGYTTEAGFPELPLYTMLYHVDPFINYDIILTIISSYQLHDVQIYPSQNEINNLDQPSLIKNTLFYNSKGRYPTENIWISNRQVMRGEEFITFSVTPFIYYPENNILEVFDEIEIEIIETGPRENPNYQTKPRSRVFEKYMEKFSNNYNTRINEDFQPPAILYICGGSTIEDSNLQALIEWRHQRGYIVYAVPISDIGNTSEDIQNYIEQAYNTWDIPPEFVTIVGDASGNYEVETNYEYYSGVYGEGDWPYSLLEGDDFLPEVIIGRLSVRTPTHLGVVVNKILNYEKAVDMSEGWYETAALIGDPSDSGISTVITNEYIEQIMENHGLENINTKYNGSSWSSWIENQFNDGVLYINYRGYIGVSGFEVSDVMEDLNNYTKHPFATFLTCDTGSFDSGTYCLSETLLRAGTPNAPLGAIAAVGTSTIYTHTAFNNIVAMGIYEGIFLENNHTAGEALSYGKLILSNTYPSNPNNNVNMFSYWNNLMGDGSTHLWTKRPEPLIINCPAIIQPGTNHIEIKVEDINGEGVEDVFVTLLKGDDDIFTSRYTNSEGVVIFNFSDNTPGEALVTVVKQDYIPSQIDFTIQDNNIILSTIISEVVTIDDGSGASIGNNDGIINSGEIIELGIPVHNSGVEIASELLVRLQTNSEFVDILDGEVFYGNIAIEETIIADPFVISISPESLDGIDLGLYIEIMSNTGDSWVISIPANISGGRLIINEFMVQGDENSNGVLDPGESGEIYISIQNTGSITMNNVIGSLGYSGPELFINEEIGSWGSIQPDEVVTPAIGYSLAASYNVINGSILNLELLLESEEGYLHSEILSINIGNVTETDPLGPDNHGYYIYDDGDTGYEFAPEYDWIEIDPEFGGSGENLDLSDNGNGNYSNSITTIELPFPIIFYGIEYTQMTIGTNGWVSFGETEMESFRNYQLPGAGGPSPMVAVFWDDLKTTSGGDVFHYTNPDNEYYIVEWSNLRTFDQNSSESFQVIFYNDSSDNPTGDNEMLFQYKVFNNTSTGSYPVGYWDDVIHGGYCSIGLENHLGTDGLEYTFNNEYSIAAKPLTDFSSLFITTRTNLGYMLGDVNVDGYLNILDVVIIVNQILEIYSIDPEYLYLADTNSDGVLDILDVVTLINLILE